MAQEPSVSQEDMRRRAWITARPVIYVDRHGGSERGRSSGTRKVLHQIAHHARPIMEWDDAGQAYVDSYLARVDRRMIEAETEIAPRTITRHLATLVDDKRIERDPDGRAAAYRLPRVVDHDRRLSACEHPACQAEWFEIQHPAHPRRRIPASLIALPWQTMFLVDGGWRIGGRPAPSDDPWGL